MKDTRNRRSSGKHAPRTDARSNRPKSDRPQSDRPQSDRPQSDRPRFERPQSERPQQDRAQGDRPKSHARDLVRVAGFSAVAALFATAPERVERLFFDARSKDRAKDFCAVLSKARKVYRELPKEELDKVAGTAMHGGIVAVAQPRAMLSFDAQAARNWARDGKLLLILDGIGNPHNLGAIVRTAAFFGVPRILLSDHAQQALPSDASHRVAEGGFEHVEIYRTAGLSAQLAKLRGAYRIVGAAPSAQRSVPAPQRGGMPFALVLGNEEAGLSKATLAACDEAVAIPGAGKVESLNVSAAAAVLIYALGGKPS
jgi:TrmH RNA methyltransferase